jgi:hypothetical protein
MSIEWGSDRLPDRLAFTKNEGDFIREEPRAVEEL